MTEQELTEIIYWARRELWNWHIDNNRRSNRSSHHWFLDAREPLRCNEALYANAHPLFVWVDRASFYRHKEGGIRDASRP